MTSCTVSCVNEQQELLKQVLATLLDFFGMYLDRRWALPCFFFSSSFYSVELDLWQLSRVSIRKQVPRRHQDFRRYVVRSMWRCDDQNSVAGVGWATSKAIIERLLPLWLSAARSLEFDWNHITTGLEANINLVRTVLILFLLTSPAILDCLYGTRLAFKPRWPAQAPLRINICKHRCIWRVSAPAYVRQPCERVTLRQLQVCSFGAACR